MTPIFLLAINFYGAWKVLQALRERDRMNEIIRRRNKQ
jgi:hypothetical protein